MSKKIFITGVARSGTTILARMFHAFDSVYVVDNEIPLKDYISVKASMKKLIVGKRTEYSIFSNILSQTDIDDSLKMIKDNDIIVINCVRDGRFVVDSWVNAWQMYNPFAWITGIMQSIKYKDAIKLTVKYEDLVSTPLKVQKDIVSLLGMETKYNFADYPEFVPDSSFKTEDNKYKLRSLKKLEDEKIPQTYLAKPNDLITFNELLIELGYE